MKWKPFSIYPIWVLLAILVGMILVMYVSAVSQKKYNILISDYGIMKRSEIVCQNEMGKIEIGNNQGQHIKLYMKYVGLNYTKKYPYCAAGISFCYGKEIPFKRSASANRIYDNIRKQGYRVKYEAKKHNLLVWKNLKNYNGHISRIKEVQLKGWVLTYEFNTGDPSKNQREGDGNYIKRRNIYHILGRMKVRGLCGFDTSNVYYLDIHNVKKTIK